MDEFDQLLSGLPPGAMEQLLGLGSMDERSQLLQQQLAQAEALRNGPVQSHSTGLGAAFGGLGDVANGIAGAMMAKRLGGQVGQLLDEKTRLRKQFVDMLRGTTGAPVPGSAGVGDIDPFAMGGMVG